ncbi:MAG: hypothetical protein J6A89_05360 [Clostridia bacterium]|nr:hypothetical protein [Clostridia bacterium]
MNTEIECLKLANNIRNLGFKVDIEMCNKKLKKSLSFANKENIPFVIILGDDEIKNKWFYLKDMRNNRNLKIDFCSIDKLTDIC